LQKAKRPLGFSSGRKLPILDFPNTRLAGSQQAQKIRSARD
jgi:hypothetical protein